MEVEEKRRAERKKAMEGWESVEDRRAANRETRR